MPTLIKLQQKVSHLKSQTLALYLAARHPQTPWYAKWFVIAVVAYALSPIDLIPDFIPVLGYVDDVILVPLGIALAIKMIPPAVMAECRTRADEMVANMKSIGRVAAVIIVAIWLVLAALFVVWIDKLIRTVLS